MSVREELDKLATTKWTDPRTNEEKTGHARARFTAAKGAIAQAYNLESRIRELSHEAIVAFKAGDVVGADERKLAMDELWEKMAALDLPGDVAWQHDAQAAQERGELYGVLWLHSKIFGGPESVMPSAETLRMTIPSWLAGLADAVTETSKLLRKKLRGRDVSRAERISLREKFISVAEEVLDFLNQFEDVLPMLVNNSRYRGFMNTFRGVLGRVERCIEIHEEALVAMLDRMAADAPAVAEPCSCKEPVKALGSDVSEPPYDPPDPVVAETKDDFDPPHMELD